VQARNNTLLDNVSKIVPNLTLRIEKKLNENGLPYVAIALF